MKAWAILTVMICALLLATPHAAGQVSAWLVISDFDGNCIVGVSTDDLICVGEGAVGGGGGGYEPGLDFGVQVGPVGVCTRDGSVSTACSHAFAALQLLA